ncbi:MAG: hypothetical protein KF757_01700 [Phycisphaeraceae bacterium]|nr:hypothetical protein [Phycisphaeraceae bacterium]MCW5761924.1 hypothetical protein [Phycisphaeraceae bacterium]
MKFALAMLGVVVLLMQGCAGPRAGVVFVLDADAYESAIGASRSVLRDAGFEIDRVDAEAGIITTLLKPTAGFATPWDGEQSTLGQETSDLLNQQHRSVTITFASDNPDADLRLTTEPIAARVDVVIYRIRTSGWKIETETISRSSFSRDPIAQSQGSPGRFAQPVKRDDKLAERLSARIQAAMGRDISTPMVQQGTP